MHVSVKLASLIVGAALLAACQDPAPASPPPSGAPFWPAYIGSVTSPTPPTWQPKTLADMLLGPERAPQ